MGRTEQLYDQASEPFNYDEVERAVFGRVEQSREESRQETLEAIRLMMEFILGLATDPVQKFRKRDVGSRAMIVARIMYPNHPMVKGSFGEMAERIGCSKQAIHQIETIARRHFKSWW